MVTREYQIIGEVTVQEEWSGFRAEDPNKHLNNTREGLRHGQLKPNISTFPSAFSQ